MNIFNKLFKRNEEGKPEIKSTVVIAAIVIAVFFSVFGRRAVNPGEKPADNKEKTTAAEENINNINGYFAETEQRLKTILSGIDGAGDVDVMIYYNNTGEKVVASDNKEKNEKSGRGKGGEEVFESADTREESTVLYGQGNSEKPFVTEEKLPKPGGVLVLAEGAKNEKIKYEISEAVRALLGIPPNRIRVSPKINK